MLEQEELAWLQERLKELLFDFDDFCKEQSISYQMTFGTLLGAVRHQGFIPWDDDVDVLMTEEEFRKLQKKERNFPDKWRLEQHKRHPGIYVLYDLEKIRPWNAAPLGFDIFLIRETGSVGLKTKQWQNFLRSRQGDRSSTKDCWRYTEEIVKFSVFPAEKLFPSKPYLFEGREMPGAHDAHWCLAHEYGADYMTPLPPNLRKSHNKKPAGSSNTCSGK